MDPENLSNTLEDRDTQVNRTPLLFLGHGSPMNAMEDNVFTRGFRKVAGTLERPAAVLCISAHWFIRGTKVTAMEEPRTIHDFYGFPRELYEIKYPASGNPEIAEKVRKMLSPTPVEADMAWGLDHGTWSVMRHIFPNADIPIIQLSIDHTKSAAYHYELARKLRPLRDEGVLIVGSGNIVHNLGLVDFHNIDKLDHGYEWAWEARSRINELLLEGDHKTLIEYKRGGRAFQLAIPTPDHFLPLIYVLGSMYEDESVRLFNDKLVAGSLTMTSLLISKQV
ncbi:MAG: 4,5-DOPA dioxygenase extradiol [Thermoplasmatota archaeon]